MVEAEGKTEKTILNLLKLTWLSFNHPSKGVMQTAVSIRAELRKEFQGLDLNCAVKHR